jgi:polyphosphate kinase
MESSSFQPQTQPPVPTPPSDPAARIEDPFLDRDLSWLAFNHRVLHEAVDERTPLLERLRFLGIFASNQDEFFMKRVGRLKRAASPGMVSRVPEEMNPAEALRRVRQAILPMLAEQARCYAERIRPQLAENGVYLLAWDDLTEAERGWANSYFRLNVFPVLTPLAVDPGHPFPFISNLSTSLAVALSQADRDERSFARVKIPEVIPQWIRIHGGAAPREHRLLSLLDLIRHNLDQLFAGMRVLDTMAFRVTRDAEVEWDDEDIDDLRDLVEQELRHRRFAQAVRLEHGPDPNHWMLQFLMQELKLTVADVYEMPAELDYTSLGPVAQSNLPKLRYEPWTPITPQPLANHETDIFSLIRSGDMLLHHPYESFSGSVERFVRSAAEDPRVLAIKMTVYRTAEDSPFIHTLIRAAEAQKQVVCLVELKARFDEERNILLAHRLEDAGVHVVYGLVGLKTHCKAILVVRQDPDGIRCYAHIGTGNYHSETARLYTDLGLLTCRPQITDDLVRLFNYLSGRSLQPDCRKLLVAPATMRDRFLEMIDREIEHQAAGRPAHIIAKMNSMEDHKIIRALYRASRAGVKIQLIVRGFCCLRPGIAGVSENIQVMSVIGRFLEHSRIFYFRNGALDAADGEFHIGSADWMYRNLLYRVELVTPVEDSALRAKVWEVLRIMLEDNRLAWDMQPDGRYVQRHPLEGQSEAGTHQVLMALTRQREGRAAE